MSGRNAKISKVLALLVLVVTMVILASTNLGENVNMYAKEFGAMQGSKGMEDDESSHKEFESKESFEGITELGIEQDDQLADKKTVEKGQKPDPESNQEKKGQIKDDKKSESDDSKG